jgi:hypothetical protein
LKKFLLEEATLSQETTGKNREQIALLSGAIVPVSGVWRPDHDNCGSVAELWLPKRARFPHCPCCGRAAQFMLVEEVGHISEDPDFQ